MNYIFVSKQNKVIEDYNRQVENLSNEELSQMYIDAQAYNNSLSNTYTATYDEAVSGNLSYSQLLDISNSQMGYVVIPKISVNMPIYHSDNEDVLQIGVGHMENTSLPIGGKNTHCVLSGHTGVPGTKIFTDLTKMEVGDRFYVKTLDEILCYEVDQIKTVLPNVTEDLLIIPDRDLVTLLTCTPYGENTHRLLVRGTRVEYKGELDKETEFFEDNAESGTASIATLDEKSLSASKTQLPENFILIYILLPIGIATAVILPIIVIKRRKKKKTEQRNEE